MERRAVRLLSGVALIALIGLVLGLSQAVPVRAATPAVADLAITKAVSNRTPNVGNTVTFTVDVTNHGPDAATNVVVSDRVPAGLTHVSSVSSQGTYNQITGLWNVGTVGPHTLSRLSVTATVASPGFNYNTAEIVHSDQFDPDLSNNTFTESWDAQPQTLPTSTAQCMHGGWQSFGVFRNQGDCVSFVATGRRNLPSG